MEHETSMDQILQGFQASGPIYKAFENRRKAFQKLPLATQAEIAQQTRAEILYIGPGKPINEVIKKRTENNNALHNACKSNGIKIESLPTLNIQNELVCYSLWCAFIAYKAEGLGLGKNFFLDSLDTKKKRNKK